MITIRHTLLVFLLLPGALQAEIPVKKSNVVCSLIMQMRPFHTINGTSSANTNAAITAFREFRLDVLNKPVIDPARPGTSTDFNQANERKIDKVAARIRSIEKQYSNPESKSEEQSDIIAGVVIQGRKEVYDFLEAQRLAVIEIDAKVRKNFGQFWNLFASLVWHDKALGYFSAFTTLTASAALNRAIEDFVPFFMLSLILQPDAIYQFAANHKLGFNSKIDKMEEALQLTDPSGAWFFDSTDSQIHKTTMSEIWTKGRWDSTLAKTENDERIAYRFFMNFFKFGYKVLQRPLPPREFWTYTDRLLTFDPETNEPRLILFLRASVERPKFKQPARKRISEKIKEGLWVPEPALAPVPVREK